jgi:hypothetical protein
VNSGQRRSRWMATQWQPRLRASDDSGQIMILSIGYALIAMVLVLVLAAASAVHLERKQLLALADAAALDAADAIDLDRYYAGAAGDAGADPVTVTDASVRAAVARHISTAPSATGLARLQVAEPTGTPDGSTVQVTLTAVARPAFVPWVLAGHADGVPLRVTSSARAE